MTNIQHALTEAQTEMALQFQDYLFGGLKVAGLDGFIKHGSSKKFNGRSDVIKLSDISPTREIIYSSAVIKVVFVDDAELVGDDPRYAIHPITFQFLSDRNGEVYYQRNFNFPFHQIEFKAGHFYLVDMIKEGHTRTWTYVVAELTESEAVIIQHRMKAALTSVIQKEKQNG